MKSVLLSAVAVLALSVSTASAGGLADPVAPVVSVADTWTGFYGGLSANTDADFDDAEVGAFVGYNLDLGNVVVGAELNVVDGADTFVSAEGRLGYDAGRFLPYASVGYFDAGAAEGELFGLGVDYATNGGLLLGAEYVNDEFSFDDGSFRFNVGLQF